jgi:sulfhydrogenase subunit beta (sulfur reductase)
MEKILKLIKKESLGKLYNHLSGQYKIYAPVKTPDQKVEYRYNPGFADVTFDHIRSTLSVKNLVFPKVENLLYYTNTKTETDITEIDTNKFQDIVLWGAHPCDTAAFNTLKSIFCWDINDELFLKRLEKLVVIGLGCKTCDEFCFCTSVDLAPDSPKGSDILLSPLKNDNYRAEIVTEKGNKIAASCPELFEKYSGEEVIVAEVKQKFSHDLVTKKLASAFEHPFWVENSLRCLGCGACAYVCPTCACFDIQDETKGKNGRRYRSWDSCGFGLFTIHTSGHNPRSVQSQRWRQRIMHKFSYMPERNKSLGCVGCGRCSSGCPVDMNIAEQLEVLQSI